MKKEKPVKYYSPLEEAININSHKIGIALSIIALILLVLRAVNIGGALYIISFTIFGISLMSLYSASTIYHSAKKPETRRRLRVFDHSAIYLQIAGTYTPFALITLQGKIGWIIFGLTWGMALVGIILKIFFTGRFSLVSTLMYIFMGWIVIIAIKPLIANFSSEGIQWLFAGGIAYTVGGILYNIKKIKFNHAIFHLLVLVGSICHFISIYFYV